MVFLFILFFPILFLVYLYLFVIDDVVIRSRKEEGGGGERTGVVAYIEREGKLAGGETGNIGHSLGSGAEAAPRQYQLYHQLP